MIQNANSDKIIFMKMFSKKIDAMNCNKSKNRVDNNGIEGKYRKDNPNYHYYEIINKICPKFVNGFTREKIFNIMISQMQYVAPTINTEPITQGKEVILFLDNPINISFDTKNYSVVNHTLPGHIFYPGRVIRTVIEIEDAIAVKTVGEGIGNWKWLNVYMGPLIFSSIDINLSLKVRFIWGLDSKCTESAALP
jgi:hypothetical protein